MNDQQGIEAAEPGDLIEVFRPGYQHWAVYIGKEEVVHLSHPNFQPSSSLALSSGSFRAVVMRQRIQEVTHGDRWRVNSLLDDKYEPHDRDIIVKEAISRVGEELPYRLTTKNCEHFATDLRYGKAESRQVKDAITITGAVLAGAGVVGLGYALYSAFSNNDEKQEEKQQKQRKQRHQHWRHQY